MSSSFFDYESEGGSGAGPSQLLPQWTAASWDVLIGYTQTLHFRAGDLVVRAGDQDTSLLIVVSGELEVRVAVSGTTRRFRLGAGSLIGEVAFFDGSTRSADVAAIEQSDLLKLSHEGFEQFSARHPGLAQGPAR